jgi:hypothetical protein
MMSKYVTRFTQLSRYAPNDVDTNEKKHEYFLNGLECLNQLDRDLSPHNDR